MTQSKGDPANFERLTTDRLRQLLGEQQIIASCWMSCVDSLQFYVTCVVFI